MVADVLQRPTIWRWGGAPQWLSHQAAWWACVLGVGWVRPSAMAMFVAVHLWFERRALRQELVMLVWAVGVGLATDATLAATGSVTYFGGMRLVGVPLWMISLWAGFGATALHSQFALLRTRGLATAVGAFGGPAAYLGGERLGCMEIHGLEGALAVGAVWSIALGLLSERARALLVQCDEKELS